MDDSRRRRRGFFDGFDDFMSDDFFAGFDEEFKRMRQHMGHIFEEAMRNQPQDESKKYVYGFSMQTGPDGRPHFKEFGNVPKPGEHQIPGEREPLVDVIEGSEEITVIAELPGVNKEDIDLEADERSLTIDVDKEERRYHKELEMPCDVSPKSIKASYKNGVLEVKLKRMEKCKERRKKIKID